MQCCDYVVENGLTFRECYRVGKVLGRGSYGEVRMCVHRETGAQRAVKVLKKSQMDSEEERMLHDEISILKELDHPNIIKMYEYFQDDKRYYLVTEICKGGELFEEISSRKKFTERDASLLMRTILMVVNYCHQKKIAHRDLKPENILLEANKDYDQIKIIDFGAATKFIQGKYLDQKVGTSYYIAPEVLRKQYNHKCDIWSCGVMCYIFLSGIPPFNGISDQEIMKKVKMGKYQFHETLFDIVSQEAKDFINCMLQYDPEKRITATEALKHAWINICQDVNVDNTLAQGALANLKTFRADQKLKQATYTYIGSQLIGKSEKESLAKIFKAMDKDGDGKLSKNEIMEGYEKFFGKTLNNEDVDKIFDSVDLNRSGFIDFSEFLISALNEKQLLTNEKLAAAFKMFDKDGSGLISADEIRQVLSIGKVISTEMINELMQQIDETLDGEITYEKFTQLMKKLAL